VIAATLEEINMYKNMLQCARQRKALRKVAH